MKRTYPPPHARRRRRRPRPLAVGLAACGDDADEPTQRQRATTTSEATDRGGAEEARAEPAPSTFGDGCAAIPTEGKGSFDGMVTDPVATAASNNPLLTTLVTAVGASPAWPTPSTAPRP